MADLLRRTLAPLTDRAWQEVDELAIRRLRTFLTARRIVDVNGPYGWDFAAVNLGRLDLADEEKSGEVPWGIRQVLPLVEVRLPFVLTQMELDAVSRGANDPELGPLEEAVRQAALFEERAIYQGLDAARIQGLKSSSAKSEKSFSDDAAEYPAAVAWGVERLRSDGIPRPYSLVLGMKAYAELNHCRQDGYPAIRLVREMVDGEILASEALTGGVLLSSAAGHFELTLGQDWSLGYASHDRDQVELYLTESFMFRVLEPAAVVDLSPTS